VESLTAEIESRAGAYLQTIDDLGGAVRAIERGFQQREIHQAAYAWQKQVESGDAVVIGVNRHADDEAAHPPLLRVDEALERRACERLAALRAGRDRAAAEAALDAVEVAARGTANLLGPILAAVEAEATLGEISDRLRRVFGEHRERFAW
jgi:methylmalonyl-CoA mutase N-terminal domain/subunit